MTTNTDFPPPRLAPQFPSVRGDPVHIVRITTTGETQPLLNRRMEETIKCIDRYWGTISVSTFILGVGLAGSGAILDNKELMIVSVLPLSVSIFSFCMWGCLRGMTKRLG